MSKQKERQLEIVEYLRNSGGAGIRELAERHNVSMMTIRRDLESLKERHLIKFFHGGAAAADHNHTRSDRDDYLLDDQKRIRKEEKRRISKAAAALIEPRQTVMMDSGTTINALAHEIQRDMGITVVCWSLNIIEVLSKSSDCTIISSGGLYHPETQMFESDQGMEIIRSSRASTAFISAGGIHEEMGVTSPFQYEAAYKRAALGSSTTSVLLVDSTKFGRVCTSHIGEISDFDIVITDDQIDPGSRDALLAHGVRLIVV